MLESRARRYRGGREPIGLKGRTVLMIDDGTATGSTARAACRVARARGAARIVLAVPVALHDWTAQLGEEADELICLHTTRDFRVVCSRRATCADHRGRLAVAAGPTWRGHDCRR